MISKTKFDAIPGRKIYNRNVTREVLMFHESDWDAAEVNIDGYKRPSAAYASYKAAADRCRVAVTPIIRSGRLFLVRSGPSGSESV